MIYSFKGILYRNLKELLLCATRGMNLSDTILIHRPKTGKTKIKVRKLVLLRGHYLLTVGYRRPSGSADNILYLDTVDVDSRCVYIYIKL